MCTCVCTLTCTYLTHRHACEVHTPLRHTLNKHACNVACAHTCMPHGLTGVCVHTHDTHMQHRHTKRPSGIHTHSPLSPPTPLAPAAKVLLFLGLWVPSHLQRPGPSCHSCPCDRRVLPVALGTLFNALIWVLVGTLPPPAWEPCLCPPVSPAQVPGWHGAGAQSV